MLGAPKQGGSRFSGTVRVRFSQKARCSSADRTMVRQMWLYGDLSDWRGRGHVHADNRVSPTNCAVCRVIGKPYGYRSHRFPGFWADQRRVIGQAVIGKCMSGRKDALDVRQWIAIQRQTKPSGPRVEEMCYLTLIEEWESLFFGRRPEADS